MKCGEGRSQEKLSMTAHAWMCCDGSALKGRCQIGSRSGCGGWSSRMSPGPHAPRSQCPPRKHQREGYTLRICGRWPALGTLRDKHNWFSISNSSWTSGLLFLLNLHATYNHTPNTPSHPTHTHTSVFSPSTSFLFSIASIFHL